MLNSRRQFSQLLRDAAQKEDVATVRNLLKNADINSVNANGDTALHIAMQMGNVGLVRALLVAGARVDEKRFDRRMKAAIDSNNIYEISGLLNQGIFLMRLIFGIMS